MVIYGRTDKTHQSRVQHNKLPNAWPGVTGMIRGITMTFLVAQTAMPPAADWFTPLLNLCVLGPVCYWFMKQEERRATERREEEDHRNAVLRDLTKALNSNSNALMVAVLALKNGDGNIAELAQKIADDTKLRT